MVPQTLMHWVLLAVLPLWNTQISFCFSFFWVKFPYQTLKIPLRFPSTYIWSTTALIVLIPCSGEASSDELVMQNFLRMRKHDPACAMHSFSKSTSYQPIFTSYRNASISDYYLLLRHTVEVKLPLPRQISSQ